MKSLNINLIGGENILVCLNCLSEVEASDLYCRICGASIEHEECLTDINDVIEELKDFR